VQLTIGRAQLITGCATGRIINYRLLAINYRPHAVNYGHMQLITGRVIGRIINNRPCLINYRPYKAVIITKLGPIWQIF